MSAHRKYPQELADAAVALVRLRQGTQRKGAIASVARQFDLRPSTIRSWLLKAETAQVEPVPDHASPGGWLGSGLLWCRSCQTPMTTTTQPNGLLACTCPAPGCRRTLPAAGIIATIGRVILAKAPHAVPHWRGAPPSLHTAAAQAPRLLQQVTVGDHPGDLTFTWHPHPHASDDPHLPPPDRLRLVRQHLRTGNIPAAHALLRDSLTETNPTIAPPDPERADTALLYAEILTRAGHPDTAITWATYARNSYQHLHGKTADATLTATHTLATAHRHAGHLDHAHRLYQHLVTELTLLHGPDAHPTLIATANLALVLHDQGHCDHARELLTHTADTHRRVHPGHPASIHMLIHLAAMHQACGNPRQAAETLTLAQTVGAATGHPTNTTALTATPRHHVCADPGKGRQHARGRRNRNPAFADPRQTATESGCEVRGVPPSAPPP